MEKEQRQAEEGAESHHLLYGGKRRSMKRNFLFCFILAVAVMVSAIVALALGLGIGYGLSDEAISSGGSSASSGTYKHAAVATDAPQCSVVGVDILRSGGSAVDAAIASLLCVGVINFHSTGIGGGGFMVFYNATSKTATSLDYRETAPGRANSSLYAPFGPNETESLFGIANVYIEHSSLMLKNADCKFRPLRCCRWPCNCSPSGAEGTRASSQKVWETAVEGFV